MPTYRFYNSKIKKEYTDLMSISEMEEFIKKKHIKILPPTQLNIVSSTGSLDSKTDSGWKEVLSKVSEAHPASNLASQYGKKSIKDTQVHSNTLQHLKNKTYLKSAKCSGTFRRNTIVMDIEITDFIIKYQNTYPI